MRVIFHTVVFGANENLTEFKDFNQNYCGRNKKSIRGNTNDIVADVSYLFSFNQGKIKILRLK